MSSLWHKENKNQNILLKKIQRSSPTHDKKENSNHYALLNAIKRSSLPAFLRKRLTAGMTVEAAVVLPIFIMCILSITSAIEMIRLHGNLQLAVWDIGNRLSVYGTAWKGFGTEEEKGGREAGGTLFQEVSDIAFSYGYIKGEVIKAVGMEYLDQSPLLYGADGLQFPESEIFTSGDTFEIVMTYAVKPWMDLKGMPQFRMENHYYGHIWNGFGIDDIDGQTETVYIAENASVFHTSKSCTHLELTVRQTDIGHVAYERNDYGQRYSLCERCGKGETPGILYVGAEGDRYHYRRDCPGLKRTIFSMVRSEAEKKYQLCSRCAKNAPE